MMAVRRPATWFALVVAASAVSAFTQLNPTVTVLNKPQAPVPPECAEGLVAAPPRVVAEAQPAEPKRAPAPPSLDLKTRLRAVQVAAEPVEDVADKGGSLVAVDRRIDGDRCRCGNRGHSRRDIAPRGHRGQDFPLPAPGG